MLVSYVRVSTLEQDVAPQIDELKKAGCQRIFQDKISGTRQNALDEKKHWILCVKVTAWSFGVYIDLGALSNTCHRILGFSINDCGLCGRVLAKAEDFRSTFMPPMIRIRHCNGRGRLMQNDR
jgi:hypothetical protein